MREREGKREILEGTSSSPAERFNLATLWDKDHDDPMFQARGKGRENTG